MILLRATSKGDNLVAELREKRRERMTELFSRLTDEEAIIVAQSLNIMVKAIESEKPNSDSADQ